MPFQFFFNVFLFLPTSLCQRIQFFFLLIDGVVVIAPSIYTTGAFVFVSYHSAMILHNNELMATCGEMQIYDSLQHESSIECALGPYDFSINSLPSPD